MRLRARVELGGVGWSLGRSRVNTRDMKASSAAPRRAGLERPQLGGLCSRRPVTRRSWSCRDPLVCAALSTWSDDTKLMPEPAATPTWADTSVLTRESRSMVEVKVLVNPASTIAPMNAAPRAEPSCWPVNWSPPASLRPRLLDRDLESRLLEPEDRQTRPRRRVNDDAEGEPGGRRRVECRQQDGTAALLTISPTRRRPHRKPTARAVPVPSSCSVGPVAAAGTTSATACMRRSDLADHPSACGALPPTIGPSATPPVDASDHPRSVRDTVRTRQRRSAARCRTERRATRRQSPTAPVG